MSGFDNLRKNINSLNNGNVYGTIKNNNSNSISNISRKHSIPNTNFVANNSSTFTKVNNSMSLDNDKDDLKNNKKIGGVKEIPKYDNSKGFEWLQKYKYGSSVEIMDKSGKNIIHSRYRDKGGYNGN